MVARAPASDVVPPATVRWSVSRLAVGPMCRSPVTSVGPPRRSSEADSSAVPARCTVPGPSSRPLPAGVPRPGTSSRPATVRSPSSTTWAAVWSAAASRRVPSMRRSGSTSRRVTVPGARPSTTSVAEVGTSLSSRPSPAPTTTVAAGEPLKPSAPRASTVPGPVTATVPPSSSGRVPLWRSRAPSARSTVPAVRVTGVSAASISTPGATVTAPVLVTPPARPQRRGASMRTTPSLRTWPSPSRVRLAPPVAGHSSTPALTRAAPASTSSRRVRSSTSGAPNRMVPWLTTSVPAGTRHPDAAVGWAASRTTPAGTVPARAVVSDVDRTRPTAVPPTATVPPAHVGTTAPASRASPASSNRAVAPRPDTGPSSVAVPPTTASVAPCPALATWSDAPGATVSGPDEARRAGPSAFPPSQAAPPTAMVPVLVTSPPRTRRWPPAPAARSRVPEDVSAAPVATTRSVPVGDDEVSAKVPWLVEVPSVRVSDVPSTTRRGRSSGSASAMPSRRPRIVVGPVMVTSTPPSMQATSVAPGAPAGDQASASCQAPASSPCQVRVHPSRSSAPAGAVGGPAATAARTVQAPTIAVSARRATDRHPRLRSPGPAEPSWWKDRALGARSPPPVAGRCPSASRAVPRRR